MPRPLLLLLAWLAVAALRADPPAPASPTGPVALTGSNGRAAEFAGIWEARPAGLAVVVTADSPLAIVPWTKLDLDKLKTAQPALWAARQRTLDGYSVPLNLGLFAGLLTPPQVGAAMRGLLAAPATLKVPVFFHSGGATTVPGPAIPASVRLELVDFLLHPPIASPPAFEINGRAYLAPPVPTVTSTVGADVPTITIDLRHVLALMIHSDGVPQPVFRALLELCKANPDLLEDSARQLEQIRTQLPPVRFLPTDPTLQTLAPRLTEAIAALRSVTAGLAIDRSQQEKLTAFLALADHPLLR